MLCVDGRLSIHNIRYLKAVFNQDDLKLRSIAGYKARTNKMMGIYVKGGDKMQVYGGLKM